MVPVPLSCPTLSMAIQIILSLQEKISSFCRFFFLLLHLQQAWLVLWKYIIKNEKKGNTHAISMSLVYIMQ